MREACIQVGERRIVIRRRPCLAEGVSERADDHGHENRDP